MNDYKLNKCIGEIQNEIWQNSNECKMYALGYAVGQNNMLRMLRASIGDSLYMEILELLKKSDGIYGEYSKRIIEADITPNTDIDNFKEFLEKCRSGD